MNHSKTRDAIIKILKQKLRRAEDDFRHALCDEAASKEAHKVWDNHNPEDGVGGMRSNPYNPVAQTGYREKRERELKDARDMVDMADEHLPTGGVI